MKQLQLHLLIVLLVLPLSAQSINLRSQLKKTFENSAGIWINLQQAQYPETALGISYQISTKQECGIKISSKITMSLAYQRALRSDEIEQGLMAGCYMHFWAPISFGAQILLKNRNQQHFLSVKPLIGMEFGAFLIAYSYNFITSHSPSQIELMQEVTHQVQVAFHLSIQRN